MPSRSLRLALALTGLLGTAGAAFADSPWEQAHPRREQVNEPQGTHIDHDWREHERAHRRAHEMHEQEARMRDRERMMDAHDTSHLTRHDQERLNHRENIESREIGR